MRDLAAPVTVLDEFELEGHFVEVVWLPLPNMLTLQVASSSEVGRRLPYKVLGHIPQPTSPRLERDEEFANQWPPAGSRSEQRVVERAVEVYEAKVPAEVRSGKKRPALSAG